MADELTLDQQVENVFNERAEEPEQPEVETPPAEPEVPETETPEEPEPSVDIDGVQVPLSQMRSLLQFQQWAAANEQSVRDWGEVLEGRARIVPSDSPSPEQPAAETETDDDLPESARQRFEQMQTQIRLLETRTMQQDRANAAAQLTQARMNFSQRHAMPLAEVQQLEEQVAKAKILPGFVQNVTFGDVTRGMEMALDSIYYANPKYQQRELENRQQAIAETEARKRKSSKIAGSSSPATRDQAPSSKVEHFQALSKGIAAAMRGEPEE